MTSDVRVTTSERLEPLARRLAALIVFVVMGLLLLSGPARADDSAVLVADDDTVALTVDDAGVGTGSVVLQNQGPTSLELAASAGADARCAIRVEPSRLPAHVQRAIKIIVPSTCEPRRPSGRAFRLSAGTTTFQLVATPPKTSTPNWDDVFRIYGLTAIGVLVLLIGVLLTWRVPTTRDGRHLDYDKTKLCVSLPGLDADWKFSDSWAANATVITALVTGLFGTKGISEALLGDRAGQVLTIALVSAAGSVGLAGLAPMVLQVLRRRFPEQVVAPYTPPHGEQPTPENGKITIPAGLYVTPVGLVLAAVVTLTATVGQLVTLLWALNGTVDESVLLTVGALAVLAVGAYAVVGTRQNLTTGATLPAPDADATQSATAQGSAPHLDHLLEQLQNVGFAPPEDSADRSVVVVAPSYVVAHPPAQARRPAGIL